jgi:hypothetical protein
MRETGELKMRVLALVAVLLLLPSSAIGSQLGERSCDGLALELTERVKKKIGADVGIDRLCTPDAIAAGEGEGCEVSRRRRSEAMGEMRELMASLFHNCFGPEELAVYREMLLEEAAEASGSGVGSASNPEHQ